MPEGPMIHRLARDHAAALAGRPVRASSPQGRFAEAARVDGRRLEGVDAWGKHLFYDFGEVGLVHVHLGMQGRSFLLPVPPPAPRPQIRLRLVGPDAAVDLVAPRVCALVTPAERDDVVAQLGPDPLRPDASPDEAWARLHARGAPIGAVLLDQRVVAGVGNVLRAEALNLVGVHPRRPASALDRPTFDRLWRTLVEVMTQAVERGRIVTVPSPAADLPEREGRYVYKQARCRRCGAPVEVSTIGGRTSYACPRCQPG